MPTRIAIITGANSGIGLALCERLLNAHDCQIKLCLACRSQCKAEEAIAHLQKLHPKACLEFLQLDVGDLASVESAALEVKKRYKHVDFLYFNAGIMPVTSVNWKNFFSGLFSRRCLDMLMTGEGLLTQEDNINGSGLQKVFTTNLFGHFVFLRELLNCMGGEHVSQVIWTSSSNAKQGCFSLDDIQHKNGSEPYSSSKYAVDVLSVALNSELNSRNIYSHTMCPGLVMTNLTYKIMPAWLWGLLYYFLCLIRCFVPSMTLTAHAGAEALVWFTTQKASSLDALHKFHSRCTVLGKTYVVSNQIPGASKNSLKTLEKLKDMAEGLPIS